MKNYTTIATATLEGSTMRQSWITINESISEKYNKRIFVELEITNDRLIQGKLLLNSKLEDDKIHAEAFHEYRGFVSHAIRI